MSMAQRFIHAWPAMRRTPLGGLLACAAMLVMAGGAWAGLRSLAIETVDEGGQRVAGAVCDVSFQGSNAAAGAARVISPATAEIDSTGDWVTVKCAKGLDLAGAVTSIDTLRGNSPMRATGATMPSFRPGRDGVASVRVVLQDVNATARSAPVAKPAVAQLFVPAPAPSQVAPSQSAPQAPRTEAAADSAPATAPVAVPVADPVVAQTVRPALPAERDIPMPAPVTQFVVAAAEAVPMPGATVSEVQQVAAAIPVPASAPVPAQVRAAADVFDIKAVPYLNEQGRAVYRDFLGYPTPRAFAISKGGSYGWAVRASDPAAMALANCERRGGPCELYAMDKQVVWAGAQ